MGFSFQDFKTKVDMLAFLSQQGFKLDKDKSTRSCKVMKNGGGETLLVRKNDSDQHYYYTDPNNYRNKGDIIDLVCNQNRIDKKTGFARINAILSAFVGVIYDGADFYKGDANQERKDLNLENLEALRDLSYLNFRKISKETIFSKLFQSKIYNYTIVSRLKGLKYINTAFPLYDEHGELTALELRAKAFKEFLKDSKKSLGVWHSNFIEGKCGVAVLGESAIDMISHYQMHGKKRNDLFYLAFCGEYGKFQMECCSKLLKKVDPDFLVLANDNELKGCLYNLTLSGFLLESDLYFDVAWNKKENYLHVHFHLKDKKMLLGKSDIDNVLNGLIPELKDNLVKQERLTNELVLTFEEDLELWKMLNKNFLKIRGLDQKVKVHYPNLKDFNEDLKVLNK